MERMIKEKREQIKKRTQERPYSRGGVIDGVEEDENKQV